MHNKIVLDSCVFNKLFLQEPETDKAIALINHLTANIPHEMECGTSATITQFSRV